MNVDEAIQQAEAGDVEAMVQLGNYYSTKHDYIEANNWYLKASDAGDLFGTLRALYCSEWYMRTFMKIHAWEGSITALQDALRLSDILDSSDGFLELPYPDSRRTEPENAKTYRAEFTRLLENLRFNNFAVNYFNGEYEKIINSTTYEENPRILIIRALAFRELHFNDDISDHIRDRNVAYEILKSIFRSSYEVRPTLFDEFLWADAVSYYAYCLASGWNPNGTEKPKKAYLLLTDWKNQLSTKEAKEIISKRQNQFIVKQGIFGTVYSIKNN